MGFDLSLDALQVPESLRWMSFWGAALKLLDTLEDNKPGDRSRTPP